MTNHFIQKEKLYASIWGFIVGDAMGVPYEFFTREEMVASPATGMSGYETHFQPPGTWSDDTSMMLCVIENIVNGGETVDLAKLFIKWYEDAYHTAHGEVFDIGITTKQALANMIDGVPFNEAGLTDERSAGNGSLMRSLPYAFLEDFDISSLKAKHEGYLTHRLTICSYACIVYINYIRNLMECKTKEEALLLSCDFLINETTNDNYADSENSINHFARLMSPGFSQLSKEQIKSSGYVIHSLEASIWTFMNSSTYQETVINAVNLGGDTDTIAALAGGIAGAYYGMESIPTKWLDEIVRKTELEMMLKKWIFESCKK